MVIVRAEYIIGNLLIALSEKGIFEVSVPTLHAYGLALQRGPFSDGSVLIHHNHQELVTVAEQSSLFRVYEKENTHYICMADGVSLETVKSRYMGFLPPSVLVEIYQLARKIT